MTAGNPFTVGELEELLEALSTRRDQLAKIYAVPARMNPDWKARDEKLGALRDKIIGMLKS